MTNEQPAMSLTVEDFLSYVKETKSKHTFKEYRIGIEKASEKKMRQGSRICYASELR